MEATPLGLLAFLPSSPRGQTSEQGHLALCLQQHFCFSKRLTLGGTPGNEDILLLLQGNMVLAPGQWLVTHPKVVLESAH
ncbi:hypothetical protein CapIbe_018249 [Capra ibex]